MNNKPTLAQTQYVEVLARALHEPVPKVATFDEASRAIEELLARCPIRESTSRKVHAMLKDSRWTREDLKVALGVESFSPSKGCSEADGQRAIKLLEGGAVETRRVPVAEAMRALDDRPRARGPQRPLCNPYAAQAAPPAPEKRAPRMGRPEDYQWILSVTQGVTRATACEALRKLQEGGLWIGHGGLPQDGDHLTGEHMHLLGLMEPSAVFFGSVVNPMANSHFWSRNWRHEQERLGRSTTPPERIEVIQWPDGSTARVLVRGEA